ncbi:MAG TPA: helix-turn-helix domain-containing protein [Rhizomicrobium sp.]|nr:helix-turn-helix domain-containing protein [Rhizomicrobium sp.]
MPHDPHHPREYSFDELDTAMLLTEHQVAEQLHIKPCTVRNERLRGAISYVRIGCRYYYTHEQVDDYITEHTVRATSQRNKQPMPALVRAKPSVKSAPAQLKTDAPDEMQKQAARALVAEIFKRPPRTR